MFWSAARSPCLLRSKPLNDYQKRELQARVEKECGYTVGLDKCATERWEAAVGVEKGGP